MSKYLNLVKVSYQARSNNQIETASSASSVSLNQIEFIEYLTTRYYVLFGLSAREQWSERLVRVFAKF